MIIKWSQSLSHSQSRLRDVHHQAQPYDLGSGCYVDHALLENFFVYRISLGRFAK